jgi:peptide/nickel transport system substrate-binding protein
MRSRRYPCLFALLAIAISLLAGCSRPETPQPVPLKTLVVAIDSDEGLLTPYNWNTWVGATFIGYIYGSLYARTPQMAWVPDLATDHTVSDDGLTWTVNLRQDVTWHDGKPFTADDVVFTHQFNMMRAQRGGGASNLLSVEKTDEHQVVFRLLEPDPLFLEDVLEAPIVPQRLWKDVDPKPERLSTPIFVGTGPFKLVEEKPGEFYRLQRNDDYYGAKPAVEEILVRVISDRAAQVQALKTGEVHAILVSVPASLVPTLKNRPDIKLVSGSDFSNYNLYFNHDKAPFNDVRFRQAVARAIDRQKLVKVVMQGYATPLTPGYYHPALPWTRKDLNLEYNPAEARKMLEEAGYKDADGNGVREYDGREMSFTLLAEAGNPVEVRSAELIQTMLKEIGVRLEVRALDANAITDLVWPGFAAKNGRDYDLCLFAWSARSQTQIRFASYLLHGDLANKGWANIGGVNVPEMNALLDRLDTALDQRSQYSTLSEIQAKFSELMPWVPLFSPTGNFAYRPAAYDGWIYAEGYGIHNRWSFSPPQR